MLFPACMLFASLLPGSVSAGTFDTAQTLGFTAAGTAVGAGLGYIAGQNNLLGGSALSAATQGLGGSTAADAMCAVYIPTKCGCGMQDGPNGTCVVNAANKYACPLGACVQSQNNIPVAGVCTAVNHCQAVTVGGVAGGSGSGVSSLGSLAQALGQVLGSLLSQSSNSGNSGSSGSAGCTTSYYYTSNTSIIGVDPCAIYSAPTTGSSGTTGTTGTSGTSGCSLQSEIDGTCNSSGTTTSSCPAGDTGTYPNCVSTGTNSGGDTVSVTPASGVVPLTVTASFSAGTSCDDAYDLSWGDGSADVTMQYVASASGACAALAQIQSPTHTYTSAGTYTITLRSGISLQYTSTATVVVSSPSGIASSSPITADVTGVFTLPANPSSAGAQNTPSGISGAIQTSGTGATFVGNEVASGSETSVFFGGDTIAGFVTNLISGWCQSRPWASGIIARIIPPSFFDGLCKSNGFSVGSPISQAVASAGSQPTVALSQTPVEQGFTQPTQVVHVIATTTPVIPGRVDIWAVPSSVPLGSRTTIFWNTENVTSCTESSPDGSFVESSLTGGAATVPLTQPTTYTISCLDSQGKPVTGYVVVSISN